MSILLPILAMMSDSAPSGHRYWLATEWVTIDGGGLMEPSEINWYVGASDVTNDGTYTGTALQFGNFAEWVNHNLADRSFWNSSAATLLTNVLKVDFGVGNPKAIDGIKLGGFDTAGRFPKRFELQYSDDDSIYTTVGTCPDQTYPGNNTYGALITSFT